MNPTPRLRSDDNPPATPTAEQLADQFAAQAVKAILTPTPDGLDALADLAQKISPESGSAMQRPGAMSPDLPFKVYCVRTGAGEPAKRQIAASFARYIEAEVFIHSEMLKCAAVGTDTGRFWGKGGEGGSVHYWIKSPSAGRGSPMARRGSD